MLQQKHKAVDLEILEKREMEAQKKGFTIFILMPIALLLFMSMILTILLMNWYLQYGLISVKYDVPLGYFFFFTELLIFPIFPILHSRIWKRITKYSNIFLSTAHYIVNNVVFIIYVIPDFQRKYSSIQKKRMNTGFSVLPL